MVQCVAGPAAAAEVVLADEEVADTAVATALQEVVHEAGSEDVAVDSPLIEMLMDTSLVMKVPATTEHATHPGAWRTSLR